MLVSFVTGALVAGVGAIALREPMAVAFWGVVGVVIVLPLMLRRGVDYAAAVVPIVASVAWAGGRAAIVVAAVAASLWGGASVLRALRVPLEVAIVAMIVQAIAFTTWPLWAARFLLAYDLQRVVDLAVRFGPLFAINRAIDPTDAFTHRPVAYRWMNLGQDVPYALPATIWPCVLLHGSIGVAGIISRRWARMNADEERKREEVVAG